MIEYRSYGYTRSILYGAGFVAGAFGWGFGLLLIARFLPLLRILGRSLWLDFLVICVLGGLTAWWLVNSWLVVPHSTTLTSEGFTAQTLFRRPPELRVSWPEIERVANVGLGYYVAVRATNGSYYRFLFGRDTTGYGYLVDSIRSNHRRYRYRGWRGY